ncbi:hypothetical protein LBMAG56_35940 [Verrucomicrobiota bacterium]|nr:hypothetical protein LBMAG56_35940 [Verrucomicrobiota bacterium]
MEGEQDERDECEAAQGAGGRAACEILEAVGHGCGVISGRGNLNRRDAMGAEGEADVAADVRRRIGDRRKDTGDFVGGAGRGRS